MNVAVFPSPPPPVFTVRDPAILVVPSFTVNVEMVLVIVEGFIFSLNVALTFDPTTTPVTPLAGTGLVTVGLTVSIIILRMKDAGLVLPAASLAFAVIL